MTLHLTPGAKLPPLLRVVGELLAARGIPSLEEALKGGCWRFEARGFMRLTVEVVWSDELSNGSTRYELAIGHWGEQNGDAMRNPEVVYEIIVHGGAVIYACPIEFRNDYAGLHTDLRRASRGTLARDLERFCAVWAKNLREQGFVAQAREGATR